MSQKIICVPREAAAEGLAALAALPPGPTRRATAPLVVNDLYLDGRAGDALGARLGWDLLRIGDFRTVAASLVAWLGLATVAIVSVLGENREADVRDGPRSIGFGNPCKGNGSKSGPLARPGASRVVTQPG